MAKRLVSAFGTDGASERSSAVTSGQVPKEGKQSDATPHKSDEPSTKRTRQHRAWGFLPRCVDGPMQQDEARDSRASRQFQSTGEVAARDSAVQSSGRVLKAVDPYFVDNCQGRSGQPDNQSINRGKGRT